MADPRVSVIVPFYGVEDYFRDCLESLRRQTYGSIEFILVDDGSYDRSFEIAAEFAAADDRFRIVRQENQGLGPARNTGVAAARGEFIAFVDSDDVVAPRAYELMVASLDETGSEFASGNVHRFARPGWSVQSWTHRIALTKHRQRTHIGEQPVLVGDRMAWNKLIRRSFWDRLALEFPPIRYEDYPVTMRMHLEASAVDVLSDPIYFWRDRASGTSITQQAKEVGNMLDRIRSNNIVLDLFSGRSLPAVERELHNHLIDVDIVALARGFAGISEERSRELAPVVHSLAQRIEPRTSKGFVRADAVHRAMRSNHWRQVRSLYSPDPLVAARSLDASDARTLLRKVAGKAKSRAAKVAKERNRKLRFRFEDIQVHPRGLRLTVKPQVNRAVVENGSAGAWLVGVDGAALPLEVVKRVDEGVVLFDVEVSQRLRELTATPEGLIAFEFGLSVGPVRWRGQGEFDREQHLGLLDVPGLGPIQLTSSYVQRQYALCLRIARLGDAFIPASGRFERETLLVEVPNQPSGSLSLEDADGRQATFAVQDGMATIDLEAVTTALPLDNPVSGIAHAALWFDMPGTARRMVTLTHPLQSAIVEGQRWYLETGRRGQAEVVRRPAFDRKLSKPTDPVYRGSFS